MVITWRNALLTGVGCVAVFGILDSLSLAPGFSRVSAAGEIVQPLQRFLGDLKPLKRLGFRCRRYTRLKPGANETSKLLAEELRQPQESAPPAPPLDQRFALFSVARFGIPDESVTA